jgi:hypothetical protein
MDYPAHRRGIAAPACSRRPAHGRHWFISSSTVFLKMGNPILVGRDFLRRIMAFVSDDVPESKPDTFGL